MSQSSDNENLRLLLPTQEPVSVELLCDVVERNLSLSNWQDTFLKKDSSLTMVTLRCEAVISASGLCHSLLIGQVLNYGFCLSCHILHTFDTSRRDKCKNRF